MKLYNQKDIAVCYLCLDGLLGQRHRNIQGHAGRWHVVGEEPVLRVANVDGEPDRYAELGFDTFAHDETYAFAQREDLVSIHLTLNKADALGPSAVYLHADNSEFVAREWRMAGLDVDGPEYQDYGQPEGAHTYPDGNLIRFGPPKRV